MRRQHWPALLADELARARDRPFRYGEHDCCLFAANVALALTGSDPAATLRGRYKTRLGAQRLIAAAGGLESLAAQLASASGYAEIAPLLAQRGDAVLIETARADALGVIDDAGRIACAGLHGLVYLPAAVGRRAWRIE
jgi:hypothetical protein